MNRKRKWSILVCAVCLGGYIAIYAYARLTHGIVHLQNRSVGEQEVVARPAQWSDLLIDMSEGRPVVEAYARGQKRIPEFLNVVFWPLRTIEAAWWNRTKG
jgi:hypothetical protein